MNARLAHLDALRAALMLGGIVFHSALAFAGRDWAPWVDASWAGWGVLADFLRTWRMPAFFLLAGFFSTVLLQRTDVGPWLRRRVLRLALPLLFGLLTDLTGSQRVGMSAIVLFWLAGFVILMKVHEEETAA